MEGGLENADAKGLDRKADDSVLKPSPAVSPTRSQISLPSTPGIASSVQSRQASSDRSSDIAPEIVVWSENMDFDDMSQQESDDESPTSNNE